MTTTPNPSAASITAASTTAPNLTAWQAFNKWSRTARTATVLLVLGLLAFLVISNLPNAGSLHGVPVNNTVTTPIVTDLTDNIELGQTISMQIDGLKAYNDANKKSPGSLILYLNGVPLKLHPGAFPSENVVSFYLERTEDTKDVWLTVLRPQPNRGLFKVPVNLSAGYENQAPFPTNYKDDLGNSKQYYMNVLPFSRLVAFLVLFLGLLLVIGIHAPSILCDRGGKTYSLARTLFMYWTCIILVAFGFIYAITWDYNTLSASAVILLGIIAGTTLGAVLVDAGKPDDDITTLNTKAANFKTTINALSLTNPITQTQIDDIVKAIEDMRLIAQTAIENAKKEKTTTKRNWLKDLASDANGVSLQRIQVIFWSVALGIIFLVSVATTLSMPTFSDTLLLLIGISSGTYLGLKIPEQPKTS